MTVLANGGGGGGSHPTTVKKYMVYFAKPGTYSMVYSVKQPGSPLNLVHKRLKTLKNQPTFN